MTYASYHSVIKGAAPKNAPTYEPPEPSEDPDIEKYICTICTYVYQSPDILFEDLPDNWVCPFAVRKINV